MTRVQLQYQRACQSLAGGVCSSTRVNQALGHPMLIDRAAGCRIWDLDQREYIDLCCSHGATLLGHGAACVREAVDAVMARGAACSYESPLHTELAELLCETVPCLERVRLTGSGSEATMHCLRLARAYTGRSKLLCFEGNFHGYHDQVMFGPTTAPHVPGPLMTPLVPLSAGVAPGQEDHLIQIPFNQTDMLEQVFQQHGDQLAAAICEPIYYNAGCILPTREFIHTLRRLTQHHGTLLIFDEVLSAFRMVAGGAQEYLAVTPDLCTLGKAVGGGFPLSVFGGRQAIMHRLMPTGDCQHSGTYNGHPVTVAAALAAIRAYRQLDFYPQIHATAERLYSGLRAIFIRHRVEARVQGLGARFGIYFGISEEVRNHADAQRHDRKLMLRFIAACIRRGVYLHDYGGAAAHHGFCAAMTQDDVDEALRRMDAAVSDMLQEEQGGEAS